MVVQHFGKASGFEALGKTGKVTGFLLGKAVEGMEACAAVGELAGRKISGFMTKAIEAAKITIQHLATKGTIPFALSGTDSDISIKKAFNGNLSGNKKVPVPKISGPKLAPA